MSHGKSLSLGELVYDLNELPSFYVAEIETEAERENGEFEQCLSRRLRYEAVKEFLKEVTFPHAVNFKAKKNQLIRVDDRSKDDFGPVDHLIVICPEDPDLNFKAADFLFNKGITKLEKTKEYRYNDAKLEPYDVFCQLKIGRIVKPPSEKETDGGLYRRCLTTYVCQRANLRNPTSNGLCTANKDLLLVAKSKLDPMIDPTGSRYSLKTSTKPVFDVLHKKLHLKANYVLQFCNAVMIPDFFRHYLGTSVFGPDNIEKLASIRAVLMGLEVTVKYPKNISEDDAEVIVKHPRNTPEDDAESMFAESMAGRSVVRYANSDNSNSNNPILDYYISDQNISDHSVAEPKLLYPGKTRQLHNSSSRASLRLSSLNDSFKNAAVQPVHPGSKGQVRKPDSYQPIRESPNRPMGISNGTVHYKRKSSIVSINQKLSSPEHTPSSYRIQEIKFAKDVQTFRINDKSYSVSSYFKNKKGITIKFPNFPLARVRVNSWIPLEFLQITSGQTLRDVGHLSAYIKGEEYDLDAIKKHQVSMAIIDKEPRSHLKDPIPKFPMFKTGEYETCTPPKTPTNESRETRDQSFKGAERAGSEPHKVYFIYIPSSNENLGKSEEFVSSVAGRFYSASPEKNDTNNFTFSTAHKVIRIERPLLLGKHLDLETVKTKDLIIAIIDEESRTKDATEQIRAEVYRYAHQSVGLLAMCVSKKNLIDSFNANKSVKENYFPMGLLRKVNYMLGGTNYELPIHPLEKVATETQRNTMPSPEPEPAVAKIAKSVIMGAHLAHPGSTAGVGCPSVGALVGADDTATHYFGSARLQPTLKESTQSNPKGPRKSVVKHVTLQGIAGLDEMVAERLSSCQEQYRASNSIIFFRHGLDPESDMYSRIVKAEIDQIEKGSNTGKAQSSDGPKITYITASRNGEKISRTKTSGDVVFSNRGSAKRKCWYRVARNDLNLSASQLETLVNNINQRNQVGDQVSVALPIHFAQKLAKRVFNYFHFYATDSASIEPNFQLKTYVGDIEKQSKMDLKITEHIESYFHQPVVTGAIKPDATEPDATESDATEPEMARVDVGNSNPWHVNLNNKMFYL